MGHKDLFYLLKCLQDMSIELLLLIIYTKL